MRKITYIAVHCSATSQSVTVEAIMRNWSQDLKWESPGYHYIVKVDGQIIKLLDESKVSNGVAGHNANTINVCYVGGIDAQGKPIDNRSQKQRNALFALLTELRARYPEAIIQGHRDFSPDKNRNGVIESFEWIKVCPSFNAKAEYKNI